MTSNPIIERTREINPSRLIFSLRIKKANSNANTGLQLNSTATVDASSYMIANWNSVMLTTTHKNPVNKKTPKLFHLLVNNVCFPFFMTTGIKTNPPIKNRIKFNWIGLKTPWTLFSAISIELNINVEIKTYRKVFFNFKRAPLNLQIIKKLIHYKLNVRVVIIFILTSELYHIPWPY